MNKLRFSLPALLAGAALLPASVPAQEARLLAPLNAAAPTAPAPYVSAFTDYRRDQDPALVPWLESNKLVGQSQGGHGGHQMDHGAHPPPPPPPAAAPAKPAKPAKPEPNPKPDPHAGHQHKE